MTKKDITMGIDIGGTNSEFGFVDERGHVLRSGAIPTLGHEPAENLVKRLYKATEDLFNPLSSEYQLRGAGIGAPNGNYYRGTVEHPPNLDWEVVNLRELMRDYYRLPIAVTNDANAAALGEKVYGAAQNMKDFIVITLGTGLGSGIVVNGNLVYGSDGFAGELGHTTVFPEGRLCGCGKKGCLETYASATGICETVREFLKKEAIGSLLKKISKAELTSKQVAQAALKGDKIALRAFDYTGQILGMKLADAVATTSPEAIFLFGGLVKSGDLIFEPTQRYMEEYLFPVFRNKVKLLPSGLQGKNIAVLGASALILNELQSIKGWKI
jgi:glucokinase